MVPFSDERVNLQRCKVADTAFHIRGDIFQQLILPPHSPGTLYSVVVLSGASVASPRVPSATVSHPPSDGNKNKII